MSLFAIFILPSNESPNDIVDAEYIAQRTGLSVRSVLDGKDGVRSIPRARRKPAGWFRGEVETWLAERAARARAQEKRNRTGTTQRLVRRKAKESKGKGTQLRAAS